MIERVRPIQFDRQVSSGRTEPAFLTCERANSNSVELVAKLSSACDLGTTSLAIELLAACLAGDLGLPVPEPLIVELDPAWIASIVDDKWRGRASISSAAAFGSCRAPNGFGQWIAGSTMTTSLIARAAAILTFDCLIDNPDRRPSNPNCLQRGDELRVIDHELCFPSLILGWKPPWELGSLNHISVPDAHIFRNALQGKLVDWAPIAAVWKGLSDGQLDDYEAALPPEWINALPTIRTGITKIKNARDRIDDCVVEIQRVIT